MLFQLIFSFTIYAQHCISYNPWYLQEQPTRYSPSQLNTIKTSYSSNIAHRKAIHSWINTTFTFSLTEKKYRSQGNLQEKRWRSTWFQDDTSILTYSHPKWVSENTEDQHSHVPSTVTLLLCSRLTPPTMLTSPVEVAVKDTQDLSASSILSHSRSPRRQASRRPHTETQKTRTPSPNANNTV